MMRLQHVSIGRDDDKEAQTRAFYGGLLGLSEMPVPSSLQHLNLIWFQLAFDAEIHIFVEQQIDESSGRHFCLVVDDITPIWDTLENAGYQPWHVDDIPGRPRFFCRDPSNNILELSSIEDDYKKFNHT